MKSSRGFVKNSSKAGVPSYLQHRAPRQEVYQSFSEAEIVSPDNLILFMRASSVWRQR